MIAYLLTRAYIVFLYQTSIRKYMLRGVYTNAYMQTLSYKHLQVTKLTDLNMNEHHYQVQDLSTSQQLPPQQNIIFFYKKLYMYTSTKIIFRCVKLIYDT